MTDQTLDADNWRMGDRSPLYGRSDGIAIDPDGTGIVAVENGQITRTLGVGYVGIFDDFVGLTKYFSKQDTSTCGAPTGAVTAGAGGIYEITLASDSEGEVVDIYLNDTNPFDTDKGPVFECKLQVNTAPSANERMAWGLISDRNSTLDSVANMAIFRLEASLDLLIESDDGSNNDDDNDTTIDLVADTDYWFKIDCADPTSCKFFYKAAAADEYTRLLEDTDFSIGAGATCQPTFFVQKDSGTGVPSLKVDWVLTYASR